MILMIRHTKKEGVGRNEVVVTRKGDGRGIEVPEETNKGRKQRKKKGNIFCIAASVCVT
jgi:hypothetical protein